MSPFERGFPIPVLGAEIGHIVLHLQHNGQLDLFYWPSCRKVLQREICANFQTWLLAGR